MLGILSILAFQTTTAQNILFQEDFDGGLNQMTADAGTPVGATWYWSAWPSPDSMQLGDAFYYGGFGRESFYGSMTSETADNGVALFHAEVYDYGEQEFGSGPFPMPREGYSASLTTPSINCTDEENVWVTFNQYSRGWTNFDQYIEVSTDGFNTIDSAYLVNPNLFGGEWLFNNTRSSIDISEVAAGQPDVQVRFKYRS